MPLTPPQRARYARQLALPEVGESGQIRLAEARVLIVGAGGNEVLLAGGSGLATVLQSGGVETVSSGGVESGVIAGSGVTCRATAQG